MSRDEARKAFLARWIPYGINLMNRADALGIGWNNISLDKLDAAVIFAEELATPDEYKGGHGAQKRIIARA